MIATIITGLLHRGPAIRLSRRPPQMIATKTAGPIHRGPAIRGAMANGSTVRHGMWLRKLRHLRQALQHSQPHR